jgi:hypothetical protein
MPKIGYGYAIYTGPSEEVLPNVSGLLAWFDAGKGIQLGGNPPYVGQIVGKPQFVSKIVIADTPFTNGTYTRASGGHTQFNKQGGGTGITWDNVNGVWVIGVEVLSVNFTSWNAQDFSYSFEASTTYSDLADIGLTTWTDTSSGNGLRLTNYTAKPPAFTDLLPPQYISSAINLRPAIRFTGTAISEQNSMFVSSGVSLNYSNSVFIVMSSADALRGTMFATGNEAFYIEKSESNLFVGSESVGYFSVNVGLQTNTKTLIGCVNDSLNFTIYKNGIGYGTTLFETFPSGGGSIILGSPSNYNDNASGFVGDIAEVLVYDRPVTNIERWQIEAYLNAKYSIY